jgi:hypothetical protein
MVIVTGLQALLMGQMTHFRAMIRSTLLKLMSKANDASASWSNGSLFKVVVTQQEDAIALERLLCDGRFGGSREDICRGEEINTEQKRAFVRTQDKKNKKSTLVTSALCA